MNGTVSSLGGCWLFFVSIGGEISTPDWVDIYTENFKYLYYLQKLLQEVNIGEENQV